MNADPNPTTAAQSLVLLQAKAALTDAFATELRLYRGYVSQFGDEYANSRLFAPLAAYDALLGNVTNG